MRQRSRNRDDAGIMTVAQLTRMVKGLLEDTLPRCWVRGELSNVRQQASGHVYFTLKDTHSQLAAVMFRGDAYRQAFELVDGLQVLALGEVTVYEPRGAYQLITRCLVEDGLGQQQQQFVALKTKLQAEGLFDRARKQALPPLPQRIGVMTSPTGAAIRDIVQILRRRRWAGDLVVIPVTVQGQEAVPALLQQLDVVPHLALDLLIIARGGGSAEDLSCFNDERLVRALAACSLPVISAVGHEIDFTLCDFVADRRAETPSAAAEMISSDYLEQRQRLSQAKERLIRSGKQRQQLLIEGLLTLEQRLQRQQPQRRLERSALDIDTLTQRLEKICKYGLHGLKHRLLAVGHRLAVVSPQGQLHEHQNACQRAQKRLEASVDHSLKAFCCHLQTQSQRLSNLDVQRVLRRGFALVKTPSGQIISQAAVMLPGQEVRNQLADGELTVVVKSRVLS